MGKCDKTLTYWCVLFRISSIYVRASSFESVYAYIHLYRVSICYSVDSSLLVVLVIPLADTATPRPKRTYGRSSITAAAGSTWSIEVSLLDC